MSSFSLGRPRWRGEAPVAMITALLFISSLPAFSVKVPSSSRAIDSTTLNSTRAPKRSACFCRFIIRSGPMIPSGKPGKFSTSVVVVSWPPGWVPERTSGSSCARPV